MHPKLLVGMGMSQPYMMGGGMGHVGQITTPTGHGRGTGSHNHQFMGASSSRQRGSGQTGECDDDDEEEGAITLRALALRAMTRQSNESLSARRDST